MQEKRKYVCTSAVFWFYNQTSDDDDDLLKICNHHLPSQYLLFRVHFQKATNWSNYLPLRRKVKIIAAFSCYLLQGPLKCGQLQHDWFRWYILTLQHIFTSRYEACNYKTCIHVLHVLQYNKGGHTWWFLCAVIPKKWLKEGKFVCDF